MRDFPLAPLKIRLGKLKNEAEPVDSQRPWESTVRQLLEAGVETAAACFKHVTDARGKARHALLAPSVRRGKPGLLLSARARVLDAAAPRDEASASVCTSTPCRDSWAQVVGSWGRCSVTSQAAIRSGLLPMTTSRTPASQLASYLSLATSSRTWPRRRKSHRPFACALRFA